MRWISRAMSFALRRKGSLADWRMGRRRWQSGFGRERCTRGLRFSDCQRISALGAESAALGILRSASTAGDHAFPPHPDVTLSFPCHVGDRNQVPINDALTGFRKQVSGSNRLRNLNLAVIPHQTLVDSGIDQALEIVANLPERPRTRMVANESQHNSIIPLNEMG